MDFVINVHFSIKRHFNSADHFQSSNLLQGTVYALLSVRGAVESTLTLTLVKLGPLYYNMHPEGHYVPVKSWPCLAYSVG